MIDTEIISRKLREKGIDKLTKKILITNFNNSVQREDLTIPPNCEGFGRIHHFKRFISNNWPNNPLPMDPATFALNKAKVDNLEVQLFQNAICSWRCWYCFVDYNLISGNHKYAEFKSSDELVNLYLKENIKLPVIDISGGQPDLVPEWTLWFLQSLEKKGLKEQVYVWSDDNLSNDYLWRYLSLDEIKYLQKYRNYGRVGCFKGFDEGSFSFNTRADPKKFMFQFDLMKQLVNEGFDVYGYATFTHHDDKKLENKMKNFVDLLQEKVHTLFPLRTVPLKIVDYKPTQGRMQKEQRMAMDIQFEVVEIWKNELLHRFSKDQLNRPIYANKLY